MLAKDTGLCTRQACARDKKEREKKNEPQCGYSLGGSVQGAGRLSTGELSVSLCRSVSALSVVLYNNSPL